MPGLPLESARRGRDDVRAGSKRLAFQGLPLKFILIDRILELEAPQRIVASKALSLAEEYLADHFPRFPVLPGVLMLEALVQASAWVVRAGLDFAPALVVLKEARNVTYKSFLPPGRVLRVESVCKELNPAQSEFVASGTLEGREIVKARLTLRHLNLADSDPALAPVDGEIRRRMRALFELLSPARNALAPAGAVQS
jgi:3-hydroxyacyl-[acyl-carrier-protein] dehydratase